VGKDEFISCCRDYKENIVNMSTIDFVKKIAAQCGWDKKKDEAGRRLLSDLKDALTRYNRMPVNCVLESLSNYSDSIIFIHCREPNEIEYLKSKIGATTLLITNNNTKNIVGNHADKNVFNFEYDYVVDNSGTLEDLEKSAIIFLEWMENR